MSNIGSTALQTSKQHTQTHPDIPNANVRQRQFNKGTLNMLDEARQVVENGVGQGQELNPLIYQMLGLQPQYEDHSADLTAAQQEMDGAQQQYDEAQKTLGTLKSIPPGKRSAAQRKQIAQITKGMPGLTAALEKGKDAFGHLQTAPKTITGFGRLDPTAIPKESPFSSENPLNQAQAAETGRLNDYLSGKAAVDPTLTHQYDTAEQALRAKLAQRFGPDYEGTSVGQMALQNFTRQKNEAYATWNQQQVQNYNALAFGGAANLQQLLANQITMMREPSNTTISEGSSLANAATPRISEQQTLNQWLLGHGGVTSSVTNASPIPLAAGLGSLLTPNAQGQTPLGQTYGAASSALGGTGSFSGDYGATKSALSNWMSGSGGANAYMGGANAAGATAAGSEAVDAAAGGASSEGLASLL